jgi:hypothetical protein
MMRSIFNPGRAKISLNDSSSAVAAETSSNRLPTRTVIAFPITWYPFQTWFRCPVLYQNRFLQHTFCLDADLHVINLDDVDQ